MSLLTIPERIMGKSDQSKSPSIRKIGKSPGERCKSEAHSFILSGSGSLRFIVIVPLLPELMSC
jgi:hypothetical protein